jgi:putative DNA primase/helicase
LTKDTRKEKALLLLGPSRSGKSTIIETLGAMLGKNNCAYVTLDFISNPQYTPLLMNKLCNIDPDVETKADSFESKFKTITSGETLTCNQKFVETYDFTPYCKLVMGANTFPRITDHSAAVYERLILLPCERVFALHERNIGLKDQLKAELFGVLMWAVAGLKRLNDRGHFDEKDFMKDAIEELREESNPIEVFLKENIEANLENKYSIIYKTELFEKYRQWSLQMNQQYSLSAIKFAQIVYRKYSKYTPKDSKDADGKRVWRNLKYKSNTILPAVDQKDLAWDE